MKKLVAIIICVMMMCSASLAETFVAQSQGFGGLVTVSLTVEGETITACDITGDSETPAIGGKAIEAMSKAIVENNTIDVEPTTGATFTSTAILEAAKLAFSGGSGDAAVKMLPGTYEGTAWGFSLRKPLTVAVDVDEAHILAITVTDTDESKQVFEPVATTFIPEMIEKQSVALDAITGATFSCNAVKTAATEAVKKALVAGGSAEEVISAFYNVPEKSTDVVELEYDVVVVGMGAAGVGAALSSAEAAYEAVGQDPEKVRVLAIEKAGRYGGASSMTSEPLGVNPERFQAEYNNGEDYNDVDALKADWIAYTRGDAKEDLLDMFFKESGITIDWLKYDHNFEFSTPGGSLDGAYPYLLRYTYRDSYENIDFETRKAYLKTYFDGAMADYEKLGGKYMLSTEGCELLYDAENKCVTGVVARNDDGTQYIIHTPNVILCTGGFMGNGEMMEKYMSNEYFPLKGAWSTAYSWSINDGKMIQSAIDNGAATYNIAVPPMTHIGGAADTITDYPLYPNENGRFSYSGCYSLNDIAMVLATADPQALSVNQDGQRFCREDNLVQFGPWLAGPYFYSVWSADQIAYIAENGFDFSGCVPGVGNSGYPEHLPVPEIYEVLDKCMAKGYVWKCDTLDELAEAIGVPAENLKATVKHYNELCAAGEDVDLGKASQYLWAPGEEGPWYCVKGASYAYSTCGGLDINTDVNVLDTEGNVMKGLYACGLDSMGVIMTEKDAYVTFGGCAQGWAWTTGRIAGINAVNYAMSLK